MALLCGAAKGLELVISDGLKAMLGHQLEALQLCSNYSISFGVMVRLQRFHGFRVQRVVGHEHLTQISFHDLSLSS
jgi:hypothetical protein